jgi:hypothetical protein
VGHCDLKCSMMNAIPRDLLQVKNLKVLQQQSLQLGSEESCESLTGKGCEEQSTFQALAGSIYLPAPSNSSRYLSFRGRVSG